MASELACPICTMSEILDGEDHHECVTCGHEWPRALDESEADSEQVVTDANGTPLATGDSVTVIKDLKVKGSSVTLKSGTRIKGIRIVEGDHDVDCKVDGMALMLKSSLLKKA